MFGAIRVGERAGTHPGRHADAAACSSLSGQMTKVSVGLFWFADLSGCRARFHDACLGRIAALLCRS